MRRTFAGMAAALAVVTQGSGASAGIYTDDLSKCLVSSATADDKVALMQWMFALLSINPVVKPLSSVTPEQHEALDRKAAKLFERLVTEDCRKQTVDAVKYEGQGALEASFSVLGQVAARGLLTDPNTRAGLMKLTAYLDKSKWTALEKEAGAPADATAPAK